MSRAEDGDGRRVDVLGRARKVAVTVFRCSPEKIALETTAADVDGWDSLSHTALLVGLEREFSIRFDISRAVQFATVGDLVREIERLTA